MCRLGAKVFGEILTLTHGDNGGAVAPGAAGEGMQNSLTTNIF